MKKILMTVFSVMLAGIALMIAGICGIKENPGTVERLQPVTHYETVTEPFDSVCVTVTTANVTVIRGMEDEARIRGRSAEAEPFDIRVEDGTLKITQAERTDQNWLKDILQLGFTRSKQDLKIYLTGKVYDSLVIRGTTGSVTVQNAIETEKAEVKMTTGDIRFSATAAELNVQTTTGSIELTAMKPDTVTASATTGDIRLTGVEAKEIACNTTTGSIRLMNCDAAKIRSVATTGDIRGVLLSGKNFKAVSTTGSVRCPADSGEDVCTAATTTGSIDFQVVR